MEHILSEHLHEFAKTSQWYLVEKLTQEAKAAYHRILRPYLRNRTIHVFDYDRMTIYVSDRCWDPTAYDLYNRFSDEPVARLLRLHPELKEELDALDDELDKASSRVQHTDRKHQLHLVNTLTPGL